MIIYYILKTNCIKRELIFSTELYSYSKTHEYKIHVPSSAELENVGGRGGKYGVKGGYPKKLIGLFICLTSVDKCVTFLISYQIALMEFNVKSL